MRTILETKRAAIAIHTTLFLLLLTLYATAQQGSKPPGSTEVHELFVADQADRQNVGSNGTAAPDWVGINRRDSERRERTRQLITKGEVKSAQDYHDAAFIFQHGSKPQDYLLAHILATAAVAKGDANSLWIAAATLDRYLQSIDKSQVFGTQYFQPEDSKPWTQDPYDRELVPDGLRSVFGVPIRSLQQKTLDEEYNKARPAKSPNK